MAQYRVFLESTDTQSIIVNAPDVEEALSNAEEIAGMPWVAVDAEQLD